MAQRNSYRKPFALGSRACVPGSAKTGRATLWALVIPMVFLSMACTEKFKGFTPVPPSQSVIYFYRPWRFLYNSAKPIVKVNDIEGVVAVTNGGWFDYVTPPGHYVIYDRPCLAFVKEYSKKATVDVKAGEICCIRFQAKSFGDAMADMDSGFEAVVVPPEQAEEEMMGLRKFELAGGVKPALE